MNLQSSITDAWYYFGVLASWEKKFSYNDGGNTNGAGSCLRPLRGLADEVWVEFEGADNTGSEAIAHGPINNDEVQKSYF